MSIGSSTAKKGFKHEQLFTDLINNNPSFNELLCNYLGIEGSLRATNVKGYEKSDVNLSFNNNVIGCSIKSAKANFNQLDRRWLKDWVSILNMPQNIQNYIQFGLDTMRNKEPNSRLIHTQYENEIINFFENRLNNLLIELFTRGDKKVKLFVAYDNVKDIWYICNMKEIMNTILDSSITVSKKGVLKIGDYLSMQRKGGDGNVVNPPKSSPLHPSNNIQFKIKPLSIIEAVNPFIIRKN